MRGGSKEIIQSRDIPTFAAKRLAETRILLKLLLMAPELSQDGISDPLATYLSSVQELFRRLGNCQLKGDSFDYGKYQREYHEAIMAGHTELGLNRYGILRHFAATGVQTYTDLWFPGNSGSIIDPIPSEFSYPDRDFPKALEPFYHNGFLNTVEQLSYQIWLQGFLKVGILLQCWNT